VDHLWYLIFKISYYLSIKIELVSIKKSGLIKKCSLAATNFISIDLFSSCY